MKLFLPISTIVFAAGACCCCGSDFTSELSDLGIEGVPGGEAGEPATIEEMIAGAQDGAAAAPAGATGSVLVGTCGKFKTLKAAPSSMVQACTEGGGNDSIVIQSKSTPEDSCRTARTWATEVGYTVEFETAAMGTTAITLVGSGERMAIACASAMGQTIVSISISPA